MHEDVPPSLEAPGAQETPEGARDPRRPYRSPALRRLGCVRDLALGGASGIAEGAGTFIRAPGM